MTPFTSSAPPTDAASRRSARRAKYLGGGTNLVDLMRETIERPRRWWMSPACRAISRRAGGGLRIGAGGAQHRRRANRGCARAFRCWRGHPGRGLGPDPQHGDGGRQFLQRTRCAYFYDEAACCNKRAPGAGCDAIDGFNRMHAILGASRDCVATHPSDMCVAVAAVGAVVTGRAAPEKLPSPIFIACRATPPRTRRIFGRETSLPPSTCRRMPIAARSTYRKVRDRSASPLPWCRWPPALEMEGRIDLGRQAGSGRSRAEALARADGRRRR